MRCSPGSASYFVRSAHSLTRHGAVCRSAPTQHKLFQESGLSKALQSTFNLNTRMKTNSQMLAGLHWLLVSSTASAQHQVAEQVQLRIRQLLIGGMGYQRRPKFRDDADDVLHGWHFCCPKSTAGVTCSRTLDPLHLVKRLSSARHHAYSPLRVCALPLSLCRSS